MSGVLPIQLFNFKRGSVPMSARGSGFVRALQKIEQGPVGFRRLAHGFVRKDEFAKILVVAG